MKEEKVKVLSEKYEELFQNEYKNLISKQMPLGITIVAIIVILIAIIVIMVIILETIGMEYSINTILISGFISFALLCLFGYNVKKGKNEEIYNMKVIEPLLKELDFIEDIYTKQPIDINAYQKVKFRDNYYNTIGGTYRIKGAIHSNSIQMSNLGLRCEWKGPEGGPSTTVFSGFVAILTLNKESINNDIRIFSDRSELKKRNQGENMHMNSSKFDNEFDIYSFNPTEALEILTTDIMEKLLDKKKTMKHKYELVISNDIIAIRVFDKLVFNLKELSKNKKEQQLKNNVLSDIEFINDIATFLDELAQDINTKI